jgi:hypothetical protein
MVWFEWTTLVWPFSKFWNMFKSSNGSAVPSTIAILKTDTNKIVQVICVVTFNGFYLVTWIYMYRILAGAHTRILSTVSSKSSPFWANFLGFTSLVTLTLIFYPAVITFVRLAYLMPAAALDICGYQETASVFRDAMTVPSLFSIIKFQL